MTDRHNRIVPNLSADDFTISEDGVPQKISSFRVHKGAPAESSHQTVPPQEAGSAPPLRQLPDPPALTIFLLDYSTTEYQNQKLVRDATTKYVREKMQDNERIAVFALGSSLRFLTNFTNDRETLTAALKTTDVRGPQ